MIADQVEADTVALLTTFRAHLLRVDLPVAETSRMLGEIVNDNTRLQDVLGVLCTLAMDSLFVSVSGSERPPPGVLADDEVWETVIDHLLMHIDGCRDLEAW